MASCAINDLNARCGGEEPLDAQQNVVAAAKWTDSRLVFGSPGPPNTVKLHILEWPFIVASLRHTCAIIMPSNQDLDMPHL